MSPHLHCHLASFLSSQESDVFLWLLLNDWVCYLQKIRHGARSFISTSEGALWRAPSTAKSPQSRLSEGARVRAQTRWKVVTVVTIGIFKIGQVQYFSTETILAALAVLCLPTTRCQILCSMRLHCVGKILTPHRIICMSCYKWESTVCLGKLILSKK